MGMHNQYQGRFEKEYWVRRIYTLIQNINDISGSNINLENEISVCEFRDEDYCIVTYLYYSKLYCSCIKKAMGRYDERKDKVSKI